jgi:hypothetical protein
MEGLQPLIEAVRMEVVVFAKSPIRPTTGISIAVFSPAIT